MSSRRSPNHSSHTCSKSAQPLQQKKTPAELVTYRLDSDMVYVEPAQDFEEAVKYAQAVFPQLAEVPRSRIAFSVNVRVSGALRTVRIAPMAWPRVLRSLATYEIIDLSILPLATASRAAKSESELATSGATGAAATGMYDEPPKYGSSGMLGADLVQPVWDSNALQDSEKSPNYTLQVSDSRQTRSPSPSSSPVMKRCTSAFGWFGKRI